MLYVPYCKDFVVLSLLLSDKQIVFFSIGFCCYYTVYYVTLWRLVGASFSRGIGQSLLIWLTTGELGESLHWHSLIGTPIRASRE